MESHPKLQGNQIQLHFREMEFTSQLTGEPDPTPFSWNGISSQLTGEPDPTPFSWNGITSPIHRGAFVLMVAPRITITEEHVQQQRLIISRVVVHQSASH
jgi:hypothetical protein